tara:strand:+ start:350 stop:466 length:117 start_codon:yes stop_codon:yes gene_type:complete
MPIRKVFLKNTGFVRLMSRLCGKMDIKKVAKSNGMEKK